MSLEDELAEHLRAALRSGDAVRRDTIRQLRAALHNEAISRGHPLEDSESLMVVRRLINQHRESIEEFTRGGRLDLVAKEQAELEVLRTYAPEEIGRDAIVAAARAAIEAVGAQGRQDQGKVMRELAAQLRDRADMRTVNEVVRELLGG